MTKLTPSKYTVVYADDDPDDIELVEEAFRLYAHNVDMITFRDGSQVLSYLQGLNPTDPHPCLIILDINMPRLQGKEVLKRLRNISGLEEVPVVLFTTSSLPHDRMFAKELNAGFVTKPLDYGQMEYIITRFINHCDEDVQKKISRNYNR